MSDKTASKFLSYVLRHKPEEIGLTLDAGGWAMIDDLLARATVPLDRTALQRIVANSDKQRFAISPDGLRIRANQGHSFDVDLGLAPLPPPDLLYHGTATRNLDAIRAEGLNKRDRQHVHLSPDPETARSVGMRYGPPVVLTIAAGRMHGAGHVFFRSQNGVWLTEHVPPAFLGIHAGDGPPRA